MRARDQIHRFNGRAFYGRLELFDVRSFHCASRLAAAFVGHDLPSKYLKAYLGKQARDLFARPGDSVQVWVYAAGEDVQQAFDRLLMDGAGLTSLARLAATPQEMLDTLNAEGNAVGIVPRHWLAGTARAVYSLGSVPVLALVDREPDEPTARLIDCLQK